MSEVKVHKYTMTFGWENDNGIGEMLIQQIINGEKTATCALKDEYSEAELKEVYEPVGEIVTVLDKDGNPKYNVRMIEVFETTFGNPDLRLVRGEGDGDDVKKFQQDHQKVYESLGIEATDESILVVELFELVED